MFFDEFLVCHGFAIDGELSEFALDISTPSYGRLSFFVCRHAFLFAVFYTLGGVFTPFPMCGSSFGF